MNALELEELSHASYQDFFAYYGLENLHGMNETIAVANTDAWNMMQDRRIYLFIYEYSSEEIVWTWVSLWKTWKTNAQILMYKYFFFMLNVISFSTF